MCFPVHVIRMEPHDVIPPGKPCIHLVIIMRAALPARLARSQQAQAVIEVGEIGDKAKWRTNTDAFLMIVTVHPQALMVAGPDGGSITPGRKWSPAEGLVGNIKCAENVTETGLVLVTPSPGNRVCAMAFPQALYSKGNCRSQHIFLFCP